MRALSIKQPWLHAILYLGKRVENRSWQLPGDVRGITVALHARERMSSIDWKYAERIYGGQIPRDLPSGCLLAIAVFTHEIATREELSLFEQKWYSGPYCWVIASVRPLETPIMCRGGIGFWQLSSYVKDKLEKQKGALTC